MIDEKSSEILKKILNEENIIDDIESIQKIREQYDYDDIAMLFVYIVCISDEYYFL